MTTITMHVPDALIDYMATMVPPGRDVAIGDEDAAAFVYGAVYRWFKWIDEARGSNLAAEFRRLNLEP